MLKIIQSPKKNETVSQQENIPDQPPSSENSDTATPPKAPEQKKGRDYTTIKTDISSLSKEMAAKFLVSIIEDNPSPHHHVIGPNGQNLHIFSYKGDNKECYLLVSIQNESAMYTSFSRQELSWDTITDKSRYEPIDWELAKQAMEGPQDKLFETFKIV